MTRRRCGVEAASEECVEAHDGTNKITLCSCDSGDLCNGSPAPSAVSTSAIYTGKEGSGSIKMLTFKKKSAKSKSALFSGTVLLELYRVTYQDGAPEM